MFKWLALLAGAVCLTVMPYFDELQNRKVIYEIRLQDVKASKPR